MTSAPEAAILREQPQDRADGQPAYYSIAELARLLGVNRVTIWRWIRAGRLPVHRLGHRTVRVLRDDVAQLQAQLSQENRAAWVVRSLGSEVSGSPAQRASEHIVQFYEADGALVSAVAEFVGAGIRSGDAAIVIATPAHREGIARRLEQTGLAVSAAIATGRYVALDAAGTLQRFMLGEVPDPARFDEVIGSVLDQAFTAAPSVRAFGEMVALLAAAGNNPAALRLEQLWSELLRRRTCSLLCAYPLEGLAGDSGANLIDGVCTEHDVVIPAESFTSLADPDERLRAIAVLQQKAAALEAEIAERKHAEDELRRREAELRDFLDQGVVGLHWVDAEGMIVWANQAELDLLGYAPAEYIGHHIAEFYVDRNAIGEILRRLAARETLQGFEARLRCKDSSIRHVLVSSNVLWDGDTFVHTRCFTVDITARKRAEQHLAVQYAVTRTLSQATSLADAATPILQYVCETLGWQAGALWSVDENAECLSCEQFWSSASTPVAEFESMTRLLRFKPRVGLPGRVLTSGEPHWVADVTADDNFPRAPHAAAAGLHAAFGFPIRNGDDILGVVECFSYEVMQPDRDLLAMMAGVGGQIGQFLVRTRAERDRALMFEREQAAKIDAERERQRMREVFSRAPAAIALVCGPDHVFEFANPLYVQTLAGTNATELLGRPIRQALPDLESHALIGLLDQVYATGEVHVEQELRMLLRHGDGTPLEVFFNVVLSPFRDAFGNVEGILVHAVDITAQVRSRKRIEELVDELASERERLALAQEAAHIGTFDWDLEHGSARWTGQLEALYGVAAGGLSRDFAAWLQHVHPEDRAGVERAVRSALEGSGEFDLEFRVVWPDGTVHILASQARVFRDGDGRPTRALGVNLDVSQRRRTEEGLRFLSDASQVLALSLDPQITLRRVAQLAVPRLADWCAVDLAEGCLGHDPERVATAHVDPARVALAEELQRRYPPDWNSQQGVGGVLRTGVSELHVDLPDTLIESGARDAEHLRILRELGLKSAMIVPITASGRTLGTITLISAESGRRYGKADLALAEELAHRAGLAIDNARLYRELEEQMEAHVQLNVSLREVAEARDRALADLRQLLQVRDEFLTSAAHDLKNPLANMKANAQLLRRRARRGTLEPDQVMDGLANIDASATRMAALVNELLDVARMQLGHSLDLDCRRLDLVALVNRVATEYQQASEDHRIRVDANASIIEGEWDDERLERALGNLLSNAAKYSPGGGDIHVSVGVDDAAEQGCALIAVRDYGMGIPASDLPHIFERFYRASNVVGRVGGTGIGLAGVRAVVESHGGTVSVDSEEGVGSTFTLRLPLSVAELA